MSRMRYDALPNGPGNYNPSDLNNYKQEYKDVAQSGTQAQKYEAVDKYMEATSVKEDLLNDSTRSARYGTDGTPHQFEYQSQKYNADNDFKGTEANNIINTSLTMSTNQQTKLVIRLSNKVINTKTGEIDPSMTGKEFTISVPTEIANKLVSSKHSVALVMPDEPERKSSSLKK